MTTPESLARATPVLGSTRRRALEEELHTPGRPGKHHGGTAHTLLPTAAFPGHWCLRVPLPGRAHPSQCPGTTLGSESATAQQLFWHKPSNSNNQTEWVKAGLTLQEPHRTKPFQPLEQKCLQCDDAQEFKTRDELHAAIKIRGVDQTYFYH